MKKHKVEGLDGDTFSVSGIKGRAYAVYIVADRNTAEANRQQAESEGLEFSAFAFKLDGQVVEFQYDDFRRLIMGSPAEIERLGQENARLREALEKYANEHNWYDTNDGYTGGWQYSFETINPWDIAREALEGSEK